MDVSRMTALDPEQTFDPSASVVGCRIQFGHWQIDIGHVYLLRGKIQ